MNTISIPSRIASLLDEEAARINSPAFVAEDPVQFPRRFSSLQDIEIMAFMAAVIAWGNRKMICRDAERLISLMNGEPHTFMMHEGYLDIDPALNIHRTLFGRHLIHFMRGLRQIYASYGSLDAFSASIAAGDSAAPAWHLVENMQKIITDANNGETCSRYFPVNLTNTALKRVNMALRWLVRDDGIVDMGVWSSIPKSRLYIPLDVHVGNVSRELGILQRGSNDRKATEELTAALRTLRPEDPVYYDYALFGIGIESKKLFKF